MLARIAVCSTWLVAITLSLWLWSRFHDPAALPSPGSPAGRFLAHVGAVPYADPTLIARVRATRIAVLASFAALLLVGWLERARVARAVRRFFTTAAHPLDLAVFRLVVFWQAYWLTDFDLVRQVVSLPRGLQFPPDTGVPAIGPLAALSQWPLHALTPSQVSLSGKVMLVASIMAMLGWFSRTSALVVAVALLYGWGAIQWYGKIDHHHHVLWFALVLAASPCGDALSIDALVRGWREGRHGRTEPPQSAIAYGIPLRMCMLLMGVLYFFPGFWKIWRSGFDWFLSDAPFNQIYLKWHMIGRWLPAFRIDRHPGLVRAGALGTILFELSFIFLIFGRRTIYAAAIAGVTFHTSLNVLMRHGFETLRNCYVLFVNWHGVLDRIGRWLFPHELTVVFDGRDGRTASHVACVRALDWLGRIVWLDEAATATGPTAGVRHWPDAQRAVAVRVPLLWPLVPLLHLPLGRRAVGRLVAPAPKPRRATAATARVADLPGRGVRRGVWGAAVVGGVLVVANAVAGACRLQDSWPIACYPLFDGLLSDSYATMQIRLLREDGTERTVVPDDYRDSLGTRWNHVLWRILREENVERRRERLRLVWEVLGRYDPTLRDGRTVRFFVVRSWIRPDRWEEPPGEPELLTEITL